MNIGDLRGRQVTASHLERIDRILVMDSETRLELLELARASGLQQIEHVTLLGAEDIEDPIRWPRERFDELFAALDERCDALLDEVVRELETATSERSADPQR